MAQIIKFLKVVLTNCRESKKSQKVTLNDLDLTILKLSPGSDYCGLLRKFEQEFDIM